jgi:hypothetical protein
MSEKKPGEGAPPTPPDATPPPPAPPPAKPKERPDARRLRTKNIRGQFLDAFFDDEGYSADKTKATRSQTASGGFEYEPAPVRRATEDALREQFPQEEITVIE